jgi:hypothetical protein
VDGTGNASPWTSATLALPPARALRLTTSGLADDGTIGFAASRDLQAFIQLADQLPTREAIESSPDTALVPTSPAAQCILMFKATSAVTRENFATWMRYVRRMPKESQAVFINSLLELKDKKAWAMVHPSFVTWARENQYMFAGLKG